MKIILKFSPVTSDKGETSQGQSDVTNIRFSLKAKLI